MVFFSVIITSYNCELIAINQDNGPNTTSSSRSEFRGNGESFDWSQIEVISESIFGQNNNFNSSRNVRLAVENDKVYVVWEDNTTINGAGPDFDIFYRYFDGTIWSEIQVISEPVMGSDFNIGGSGSPAIAVENGKIYVVWIDSNNTNSAGTDYDIFYRCNLTGAGWEDIQVISEPVPGYDENIKISYNSDIAVNNGEIYVVWQDNTDMVGAGSDDDIFYRCNLTGARWEDIQIISEPVIGDNFNIGGSGSPAIAVENGKIYVVWVDGNNTNNAGTDCDIFYRFFDNNKWSEIQVISEPKIGSNINDWWSYYPAIAVENGNIYVVWVDSTDTNGAGHDSDIFYRSNIIDSGWGEIQLISEPVSSYNFNTGASLNPVITVENDRIYVAWSDMNNTNGSGHDADIFFRYYLNDCFWGDVQVISEPIVGRNFTINASLNPDITANLGKIYMVWHDGNNTNGAGTDYDIFYRCTLLPIVLDIPGVTPSSGNTSTCFNFTVKYLHEDNKAPTEIIVDIRSTLYSMIEADPDDQDYWDGKNYYFNITHLDIGVYNCRFWASDGIYITNIRIHNKPKVYNIPPNIITEDILTGIEDVYYEVDYEYEDIDVINVGQLVTWKFSSNASWLAFSSTTAILNGTPSNDDVGEYWVNITINDTINIDFTNFTLIVYRQPNISPELKEGKIVPPSGDIDTEFIFQIHYYDADEDVPTFIQVIIDNKSSNMSLKTGHSSNGTYEYKTKLSDGAHLVYFIASDGLDTARTDNFTTPYIKKSDEKEKLSRECLILIIIFIIIILLIITALINRTKKNRKQKRKGL